MCTVVKRTGSPLREGGRAAFSCRLDVETGVLNRERERGGDPPEWNTAHMSHTPNFPTSPNENSQQLHTHTGLSVLARTLNDISTLSRP